MELEGSGRKGRRVLAEAIFRRLLFGGGGRLGAGEISSQAHRREGYADEDSNEMMRGKFHSVVDVRLLLIRIIKDGRGESA